MPKILIVEDDKLTARRIQLYLQQLGYDVPQFVARGEDAITRAEADRPDLVLMDIRLKGQIDGVAAAAQIRSRLGTPIVFLTAQIDDATFQRAKTTVPFGYIPKPFDERVLQTTIEIALANHAIEMRLRESEERMRLIFENALDAVVTMDSEGTITEWNAQAERTFGWKRDEILGHRVADTIIPLHYRDRHITGLQTFLTTGSGPVLSQRIEDLTAIHHDGHEFPIELSISPFMTAAGYAFSAFVRDITDRVQARQRVEKSEQKYRTLVETTDTGYVIIDDEGRVLDANAEYVRLSGNLTLRDIAHRSVLEWISPQDHDRAAEEIKKCLEHGLVRGLEIDYVDQRGAITPIEINATVIETDEGRRIIGLCRDITTRRETEQALRQSNADLEEYAYVVSHDLKDPLGMIMRHVQLLERRHKEQLDDVAHEHVVKTIQGAKYMERLIDELKSNAEIGRGHVENVDCRAILPTVLDSLQPVLAEAKATVTADDLPTVLANPIDFAQVLQNLIGNAIKFSSDDRALQIHIGCQRDGNCWRFSVRDNGIGIAEKHVARVFQIFERIGEKEAEGTGIGLANCKKAVERRGGEIWVESELDKGSTFYFTLPRANHE